MSYSAHSQPSVYHTPVIVQHQHQQQEQYYNIASRNGNGTGVPSNNNMYPPQQQPHMMVYQQQHQQQQQQPPPQLLAPVAVGRPGAYPHRPPYVDPDTHIVYETANAEYEGYLTKQSVWLKEWRRRYFILKGSKLFFSKNEHSTPHGMMDLASCTTVKSADIKSKKRHSFEISTPETQYLLYADTESQKDDWIGRVGKAIVRCSRTYYDQPGAAGQGGQSSSSQSHQLQQASDAAQREVYQYNEEDDDIYTNDDPNNPYFND